MMLDQTYMDHPWSEKEWSDIVRKQNYFLAYEKSDNQINSFALFQLSSLESMAHLLKVLTLKSERKKGKAKALLEASFIELKNLKLERCFLEVATQNEKALSLYNALGFKKLHRIPQFYSDGSDAFTMQVEFPLNH